jgi:G3E family GTPase
MAQVNIDSKMVKQNNYGTSDHDIVELDNGCACCDASDEVRMGDLSRGKSENWRGDDI